MTIREPGDSRRQERRRGMFATFAAVIAVGVLAVGVVMTVERASAPSDEFRVEIVSPFVDLRSTLTNRANVELFRVNADAAAYWRTTTLPEYDGSTFRLPSRALERIEGPIDMGPRGTIRQQVQILALGGRVVPGAAQPVQAEGTPGGQQIALRLNRHTMTMVTPDDLEPGDLFTIVSAAPQLRPDQLRAATTSNPPDPIFVELPNDIPAVVAELAAEVTADATTPYDATVALQNWFRREFAYSLDAQSGHSPRALEAFLVERAGYAEQFAASFAVMTRTLGIPSRVAVGFTPGALDENEWYSVTGANAHAWPEIWFDDIGWVPFEPTPGRGASGIHTLS